MQPAGVFVGPLPELAARVQVGQDQLDRRHPELGVHVDRDPPAIIGDRDGAIDVDGDLDPVAEIGQVLVDRVVEHLEDAVVQTPLVGVADIHSGALPDRLQPFQLVDLFGAVFLLFGDRDFRFFGSRFGVGHTCPKGGPEPG